MTGYVPPSYGDRHTAVEDGLQTLIGLTTALQAMALDFDPLVAPGVGKVDPNAHSILVLIRAVNDKLQTLPDLHDAEWTAHYAELPEPPKGSG